MKRVLLAITVGLTVFGLVFGAAAGLNVNTSELASGTSATVSGCDLEVSVSFGLAANDITSVSEATVSGIDATACAGETLYVEVTDGTTTGAGTAVVAGTSETVTLDAAVPAADVTVVNVTITG